MNQADIFANNEPATMARRTDPATSKEAAGKVQSGKLKEFVYDVVLEAGDQGMTMAEIAARHPEHSIVSISPRGKQLENDGLIFYRGDKRNGSRVMRADKFKKPRDGMHCPNCGNTLLEVYGGECHTCKQKSLGDL